MGHAFLLALLQQVCKLMYWEQVLDTRSGYWVGLTSFGLSRVGQFWVLAFILETGFGHWAHWVRCWLWSTGCTRGRTWIQALQIILFQMLVLESGSRFKSHHLIFFLQSCILNHFSVIDEDCSTSWNWSVFRET